MIGQHKIIFTGPVGAGKTTAITTISDIAPFSTEQTAKDETKEKKELTTVAMDYGSMRLDNGETLHLYGTPGQERFNFMWDLLTDGSLGVIIMLDDANPNPLDDLQALLKSVLGYETEIHYVGQLSNTFVESLLSKQQLFSENLIRSNSPVDLIANSINDNHLYFLENKHL